MTVEQLLTLRGMHDAPMVRDLIPANCGLAVPSPVGSAGEFNEVQAKGSWAAGVGLTFRWRQDIAVVAAPIR